MPAVSTRPLRMYKGFNIRGFQLDDFEDDDGSLYDNGLSINR